MVLFGRDMAMNQTCYALATTTETPFALYCRLREEIDELVHAAHGSVFDTITTSTFASTLVVLPARPVLSAFEERIAPHFDSFSTVRSPRLGGDRSGIAHFAAAVVAIEPKCSGTSGGCVAAILLVFRVAFGA